MTSFLCPTYDITPTLIQFSWVNLNLRSFEIIFETLHLKPDASSKFLHSQSWFKLRTVLLCYAVEYLSPASSFASRLSSVRSTVIHISHNHVPYWIITLFSFPQIQHWSLRRLFGRFSWLSEIFPMFRQYSHEIHLSVGIGFRRICQDMCSYWTCRKLSKS